MKIVILSLLYCFTFIYSLQAEVFRKSYKESSVFFDGKKIVVTTGKIMREWEVDSYGLVTIGLKNQLSGKQWVNVDNCKCDWEYWGLIDEKTPAQLKAFRAGHNTDEGFTSDHLLIEMEFEYPSVETFVKYQIRAYPGAEGIYTNVSLKGNSAKYVKVKNQPWGVDFKLVSGKGKYDYSAHGVAADYIANYVFDKKKIEYFITGLDKGKQYKLGVSWWNFSEGNITQNLSVTSVDGETVCSLLKNHHVPSRKNNQRPEELLFDLPATILLDGSFRLLIDKCEGTNALLSEIWIEEKSNAEYSISDDVDRVAALKKNVEPGFALAGYVNCGKTKKGKDSYITGRVDFIPVCAKNMRRRYIGYYNDTQHRNMRETPLLKEEFRTNTIKDEEKVTWASIVYLEDKSEALAIVKESHKCVNQYGHDTGAFNLTDEGVENTGTALEPLEILPDRYRKAWATWVVAGKNTADDRELSLKRFERFRFPVNLETDMYIIANTWGSGRAADATNEFNILKEMKIQKYLGIDVQQIDDGYQKPIKENISSGKPVIKGWYPNPDRYPEGFKNVREKSEEYGMKLGLWFPAMNVKLEEMKENYDTAGFSYYKLDFANIQNYQHIEDMITKIRNYELYTNHRSKVNWDVTENAPRFGYFWAKEYGCVFLENRKPESPVNVVYVPYLVLRDLWHLSKYCNLNKFQGPVQNKDLVDRSVSDAYKHTHGYTAAIPLMATPLFFQETQFYSQGALDEIKQVLSVYKQVRKEIYESYVYPVGDEPDNASWSGFQAHHPSKNCGYLNLFREIENKERTKNIRLRFLEDKQLVFTNMMTGEKISTKADSNGFVTFTIPSNGDFRMMKYEYLCKR